MGLGGAFEWKVVAMEILVREVGPVTVLDLSGKLTPYHGDAPLQDTVIELVQGGTRRILINLDQVPYIDSAGIGALVSCYKHAVERGATVKLLNPQKRIFDLLQVVKLDKVFECFHEEQQAIASFAIAKGD
jgi:anti-sigma B factor antagonist